MAENWQIESKEIGFTLNQQCGLRLCLHADHLEDALLETLDFDELGDGDPDNSWLARCILFCLYRNKISGLTDVHQIGTGRNYRGDTMNSFNTLFRWAKEEPDDDVTPLGSTKKLVIERLQNVLGDEAYKLFREKINGFFHVYHRLGNFILLPNQSIKRDTLNTYRGRNRNLQDFFDLFLCELKIKMEYGKCTDDGLEEFFEADINKQYFENFGETDERFYDFCCKNFIEMYIDPSSKEVLRYNITKSDYLSRSKNNAAYQWRIIQLQSFSDKDVIQYKTDAEQYIDIATARINARTSNMIQELKKIISSR